MLGLFFNGKELSVIERPLPKPARDEALIKTIYAGICNTDIEILKGYMGFKGIIGHEFVGEVQEANDLNLIGKRVVGEINIACGECEFCMQGLGKHCPNRSVFGIQDKDGAIAEYLTLPLQNLHVIPTNISELQAVFIEPLAAACEIVEQIQILPEYNVLVIGDGKLGLLIARVLRLYTKNLQVIGKHEGKLNLLKNQDISTILLHDFKEGRHSFHIVVEATGSWEGWEMARRLVRPRGFIVLKSTYVGNKPFNPASLVIDEVTVVGSRCGPFKTALYLLHKKTINPLDMITKVFPFKQWNNAFQLAQEPESLKVVLKF